MVYRPRSCQQALGSIHICTYSQSLRDAKINTSNVHVRPPELLLLPDVILETRTSSGGGCSPESFMNIEPAFFHITGALLLRPT